MIEQAFQEDDFQDFFSILKSKGQNLPIGSVDDLYRLVRFDFLTALYHSVPEQRRIAREKIASTYGGILSLVDCFVEDNIMIRIKTSKLDKIVPLCPVPKNCMYRESHLEENECFSEDRSVKDERTYVEKLVSGEFSL